MGTGPLSVAMVALGGGTGSLGVREPVRTAGETLKAHAAIHRAVEVARASDGERKPSRVGCVPRLDRATSEAERSDVQGRRMGNDEARVLGIGAEAAGTLSLERCSLLLLALALSVLVPLCAYGKSRAEDGGGEAQRNDTRHHRHVAMVERFGDYRNRTGAARSAIADDADEAVGGVSRLLLLGRGRLRA